jgi:hypothetical protein
MNDKIKQLLENAEQSDAIARNKWRIENREQLRKERKEKLKELMEKDKQKTAVEWLNEQLQNNVHHTIRIPLDIIQQAKEMEKKQIIEAIIMGFANWDSELGSEQYYNETYGGDNK